MKVYLANTSRHDRVFNCRIPEFTKVLSHPIRIGAQIIVGGKDLNKPQVDALVRQLETYGGVRVGEYAGVAGRVIDFLFDVDKEVPRKEIANVMRHNEGRLVLIGKELRKEAAIAVNSAMESMTPGMVNEVELTVQQETEPLPGTEQLAEGVRVVDEKRAHEREQQRGNKKKRR